MWGINSKQINKFLNNLALTSKSVNQKQSERQTQVSVKNEFIDRFS
jgi:hypothetical protein